MRITDRSWLACGLLMLLLTACGLSGEEKTPNPTSTVPTATQIPETADRPVNPTSTVTPLPTSTRFLRPTVTNEPVHVLDPGWRRLGDERFGLQMAVPNGWVDATAQARTLESINRFSPQILLLTDDGLTAERLLSGEPLDQGAFVFGFSTGSMPAGLSPVEALVELLASSPPEGVLPITPETILVGGSPVAYVDLAYDPFGVFPSGPEAMQYRVLLVFEPEMDVPAVFVIGSLAEDWNTHSDTYVAMSELVYLPETGVDMYGHMSGGDQVQGTLSNALDNIWTFTFEGGDYATITLTPENDDIDLTLTLIDPAGNAMITIDDGYAGESEVLSDVLLTESGAYTIEVGEFFNESGRYRLGLLVSDEPHFDSGGRIEFGQEITAELFPDSRHSWILNGTAGQNITVILSSLDDTFDVILELRSPNDRPMVVLDEGFVGDAEVLTGYELPLTGEYIIVVRGFAGHGGMYALSIDKGGESTANFFDVGDLVYGDRRQEALRKDEAHAWFFTGESGDEISIEVTPLEPTMDLDIWLLDPDLQQLIMRDESLSGEAEQFEYALPLDGQYLILVREFFGEPGRYEISLNAGGVAALEIVGTLNYNDTVTGKLEQGRREGWSFSGELDEVIDIILTPMEQDRDMVLSLVDPNGKTAITVDAVLANSPERLVAFKLTESGRWTIVVKEFFNEATEYELVVTRPEIEAQQIQ